MTLIKAVLIQTEKVWRTMIVWKKKKKRSSDSNMLGLKYMWNM